MKRTERAGRKRKNSPTLGTSIQLTGVVEEFKANEDVFPQHLIATKQETSNKTRLFTTGKPSDAMFSVAADTVILPTVTDGGSAENTPVPQKKYLSFQV